MGARNTSILFFGLAMISTACSQTSFQATRADSSAKSTLINSTDVLTDNIVQPEIERGDQVATVTQPGTVVPAQGAIAEETYTGLPVGLSFVCSNNLSKYFPSVKIALNNNVPIELRVNGQSCSTDKTKLQTILQTKQITAADLGSLCPQVPIGGGGLTMGLYVGGYSIFQINQATIQPGNIHVGGVNGNALKYNGKMEIHWNSRTQIIDSECDHSQSPLVIHTASNVNNPQTVSLSSPAQGVYFDILGDINNHAPVKISWFTNHDYRLLALADANGQVKGINELFGNNTRGPDGQFAENGYAALAKYDGRTADGQFQVADADGFIDARDPVFAKLSVWLDANFNGRADAGELTSLKSMHISYIDLNYTDEFQEVDQYGNLTSLKSVVGYTNGALDLIFDLWFSEE